MVKKKTPKITPTPGYVLASPYQPKNAVFSVKDQSGEDTKSVVVAVGADVTDQEGIVRKAPCKVGDIVISTDSNKTFEVNFLPYRFIHFSEIHGILKP